MQPLNDMNKVVEIEDLRFTYPDGTEALKGLDLTVCEGESVGLIGPNGAGKSTLLLHLNGLLAGSGLVRVLGTETGAKELVRLRQRVGLVFQDPDNQLFMPTVFDDVAFGPLNMDLPDDEVRSRVEEALTKVDMLYAIHRSPHHLSYGERRRVAVATVLSMKPDLLAVDEPTSNLDPRHRRSLVDLLAGLPITKIVASHDLDAVREVCGRAVLLDGGRKAAEGTADSILTDRGLLETHGLELPLSLQSPRWCRRKTPDAE